MAVGQLPVDVRRKRILVTVAALAVIVLGASTFIGGPLHNAYDRLRSVRDTSWIQLESGKYQGAPWYLYTRESGGQLCLELTPIANPTSPHAFMGGCGFDNTHPGSGYYTSGPGPVAGSYASVGPLPSAATSIQVAANTVLPTHPLPRVQGLPRANYWLQIGDPGTGSTDLDTVKPLDEHGKPVAFANF